MLLVTESVLPSPESARDVSDYPLPSCNTPFSQHTMTRRKFGLPFESAKISVAMANVFITIKGSQETTSTQEYDLIEQSLARWCNTSRSEFMTRPRDDQEKLLTDSDGMDINSR